MSQLHFFTGKGGVGKSALACSFALQLSAEKKRVLLIDFDPNSLTGIHLKSPTLPDEALPTAQESPLYKNLYYMNLSPKACFHEYLLQHTPLNKKSGPFSQWLKTGSEKFIKELLNNKIISRFIEVCPGLKPIVLLGKTTWEARKGTVPSESSLRWDHVIVDAPTTGYIKMLLKSTLALQKAFPAGPIHKQSIDTLEFCRDPQKTHYYVCTLLEELPLQESVELIEDLKEMGASVEKIYVNKTQPEIQLKSIETAPLPVKKYLEDKSTIAQEEKKLKDNYLAQGSLHSLKQNFLPFVATPSHQALYEKLAPFMRL